MCYLEKLHVSRLHVAIFVLNDLVDNSISLVGTMSSCTADGT